MTSPRPAACPTLLDVPPEERPSFDPGFRPLSLSLRRYEEAVRASGGGVPVRIGIEREKGLVSVHALRVYDGGREAEATSAVVERTVKFLLWSRGGWRIHYDGPDGPGRRIAAEYAAGGARAFDVELMSRVYERPFEVRAAASAAFPAARERRSVLGGHVDGCRIGFDLGASDYKIAAVRDGEPVFSQEIPWNPSEQADPRYHIGHIRSGLKKAAAALPRVDAIGGSAAGVYVDNQVRVASLFRSVPADAFDRDVKPMFLRMGEEWGVPFEVLNDGEVTALAGTMTLGEGAMLGVALGSSQAAGYINPEGRMPGWLDELAFVPVDLAPGAAVDEWSGDRGVGANYFSQQAVNKLALAAGTSFPAERRLADRLRDVQDLAAGGDERALRIFDDIGLYLGYAIPAYARFYDFRNVLALGRVMSGPGGVRIAERARAVLAREFPELAARVRVHLFDEKGARVGQAVAAASIPEIRPAEGESR